MQLSQVTNADKKKPQLLRNAIYVISQLSRIFYGKGKQATESESTIRRNTERLLQAPMERDASIFQSKPKADVTNSPSGIG